MLLEFQEVTHIPIELKTGVLYVSNKYETATHICPCGCGHKVVTPFGKNKEGWKFSANPKAGITVTPSISNRLCGSHYFIRNNEIEWC